MLNLIHHIDPSWVQAIAAIIALVTAVWGNRRVDKAAKRRQQLQARCIATAIYPDLLAKSVSYEVFQNTTSELTSEAASHSQTKSAAISQARIDVPPILMRNPDRRYLLGERAGSAAGYASIPQLRRPARHPLPARRRQHKPDMSQDHLQGFRGRRRQRNAAPFAI